MNDAEDPISAGVVHFMGYRSMVALRGIKVYSFSIRFRVFRHSPSLWLIHAAPFRFPGGESASDSLRLTALIR